MPLRQAIQVNASTSLYKNLVLRHLSHEVIDRLRLQPALLPVRHQIEAPGHTIRNLLFIEAGLGSMACTMQDGGQIEVTPFGYESVIGVSALMGTRYSLNRISMQLEGNGWTCPVEAAREEFQRGGEFQRLALRYVQAQLIQAMQSAACNARHDLDQRFARWLLLCADRADAERFHLSQESLAHMLGATRPTMTLAIGRFTAHGLIDHQRSSIHIADRAALEALACECYGVVREHLHNYAESETGFGV